MTLDPRSPSLDRRPFVKASALAAAPFVLPRARDAKKPTTSKLDVIKIGLGGCGGRGTGAASNALAADAVVRLHAMGDVFADRLEKSLKALQEDASVTA